MIDFSGGRDISSLWGNGRRRVGIDRYRLLQRGEEESKKRQMERYVTVERSLVQFRNSFPVL